MKLENLALVPVARRLSWSCSLLDHQPLIDLARSDLTPILQSIISMIARQPAGEDAYSPPTTSYCLPFWLRTVFDLVCQLVTLALPDNSVTHPFRKDSFFLLGDEVRDTTVSLAHH